MTPDLRDEIRQKQSSTMSDWLAVVMRGSSSVGEVRSVPGVPDLAFLAAEPHKAQGTMTFRTGADELKDDYQSKSRPAITTYNHEQHLLATAHSGSHSCTVRNLILITPRNMLFVPANLGLFDDTSETKETRRSKEGS